MSTEITQHQPHGSVLAIHEDQTYFNDQQLSVLHTLGVKGASPADLGLFFHQCQRTGLDPFARQIYMIQRAGKQTIQTGIDGFRLIARRAADRKGETIGYADTLWADENGNWTDLWLDAKKKPAAAKVVIYRDGQPFPGVALWSEYGSTQAMWGKIPAHMLAKVAEALALRKAFPQDLSGLYTADEMDQADRRPTRAQSAPQNPAQPPQQAPVTIRRQAPAEDITVEEVPAAEVDRITEEQWAALNDWLDHHGIEDKAGWVSGRVDYALSSPMDLTNSAAAAMIEELSNG